MAKNTQTTAPTNNVLTLRPEGAPPAPKLETVEEPKPETGMSTAGKVGVGVGATGLAGVAAFGLYKLGAHLGWWGGSKLIIDIDDPADQGGTTPKTEPKPSGGGGNKRLRAVGKPPNVSGDPEGYNTQRFPHPGAVRLTMTTLGYKVAYNDKTLVPNNEPHPEVRRFQREWNKVIRGLDSGRVKFPPPVADTSKLKPFRGVLGEDGIPGKNTLNAMEIAFNNQLKNVMSWTRLVGQA